MRTFKELIDRVAAVQGVPFAELAQAHEIAWSPEPARNKGLSGRIVEAAMGIEQNPRPEADLTFLGLEIKTIPVGEDLRVLEMTKVTMLNFQDVVDHEFEVSTVAHKLRSIIFVPIVKFDVDHPEHWYIRSPFIWMPSLAAQNQLKRDYESVRELLKAGDVDKVSSSRPPDGQGVFMTANTAGRDSKDMTYFLLGSKRIATKRRAWMMRKDFTTEIIRENIAYKPLPLTRDVATTTIGVSQH